MPSLLIRVCVNFLLDTHFYLILGRKGKKHEQTRQWKTEGKCKAEEQTFLLKMLDVTKEL